MTKETFGKIMKYEGDCFKNDSCCKLQLEIIKKIVNCKAINDVDKLTLLNSYSNNLTTNNCVVESIRQYNKR